MKLKWLVENEECNKKKKSLVLKAIVKDTKLEDEDCQSKIDEYMYLIFHKFKEFLKHERKPHKFQKQNKERSIVIPTCFEYKKKESV